MYNAQCASYARSVREAGGVSFRPQSRAPSPLPYRARLGQAEAEKRWLGHLAGALPGGSLIAPGTPALRRDRDSFRARSETGRCSALLSGVNASGCGSQTPSSLGRALLPARGMLRPDAARSGSGGTNSCSRIMAKGVSERGDCHNMLVLCSAMQPS